MTPADELVQAVTLRFIDRGMHPDRAIHYARHAVDAVATAIEARVDIAEHTDPEGSDQS